MEETELQTSISLHSYARGWADGKRWRTLVLFDVEGSESETQR